MKSNVLLFEPMAKQRLLNPSLEIFSGALWAHRHLWRRAARLLPANSCLIAVDPNNQRQTQLLQRIAQRFRAKGKGVYIWQLP
jgi:hypothetical protein